MKRSLPFIIIGIVLVGGIVAFVLLSRKGDSGNTGTFVSATPQTTVVTATPAPPQTSPENSDGLTKPNVKVSSPVVLEEYGDYQCPPCGLLHPEIKKLEAEYGNQLKVVFRHFPLTKMHRNALDAARAAEAARNQNKFWEMHDRLYRNQLAWKDQADPRPMFISYARELSLNVERFTRDLDSPEIEQRIAADVQRGSGVGVSGTPTVFIEGHMLRTEATNPIGLRRGINYLLEQKANLKKG
jgi:protein-disulfide isomerase